MVAATTGLAGFTFLPASVLGRGGAVAPSEKLNIAFAGIGTRGSFNLRELDNLQQNIVAVCDVDWRQMPDRRYPMAIEIAAKYPKAKRFDDFRVMLEEMDKQIDAVVVATANHTHALISITAMKMGKHVYCEKPLAHSVEEIRAMIAAAKKYNVTTQTGCQGHSSEDCRTVVSMIKDGVIGDVREVHIFQNIGTGAGRGIDYNTINKLMAEDHPIPPELKWDLWLGPGPARKFNPAYVPSTWRSWVDYGDGVVGDYCCHSFDPIFWALDLQYPEKIEADPDTAYDWTTNKQVFPNSADIRWDFPARGTKPSVVVEWHYGRDCRSTPVPKGWPDGEVLPPAGGGVIFGSKGSIVYGPIYASLPLAASSGKYKPVTWGTPYELRVFPNELKTNYKPSTTLPRPFNHWSDWVEAAKARKQAGAPFSFGGLLSETSCLGNIAFTQKNKILYYDGKAGRFEHNDDANARLKVSYRDGFKIPV